MSDQRFTRQKAQSQEHPLLFMQVIIAFSCPSLFFYIRLVFLDNILLLPVHEVHNLRQIFPVFSHHGACNWSSFQTLCLYSSHMLNFLHQAEVQFWNVWTLVSRGQTAMKLAEFLSCSYREILALICFLTVTPRGLAVTTNDTLTFLWDVFRKV